MKQPPIPVLMVICWWESLDESVNQLEHGLESLHGVPGGVRTSYNINGYTLADNYSGTSLKGHL